MKNADNIVNNEVVALDDENLDDVQGGIVVATVGVCVIGTVVIGGTCALIGKCFYDMFKEYVDYKAEKKKAAEQNAA